MVVGGGERGAAAGAAAGLLFGGVVRRPPHNLPAISPHFYRHIIASSSSLLKQLQHISGVINANTVLPILEDFLFEVEKNKLTVVATDLETVMRVQLDIEAKDTGKVCIPARILMDSLKNIGDQPLTFNIDKLKKCIMLLLALKRNYKHFF